MRSILILVLFRLGTVFSKNQAPFLTDPELLAKPRSNLILTMRDSLKPILAQISSASFPDRGSKNLALAKALQAATKISQAPVLKVLEALRLDFETYWITNKIYVKNAKPSLIPILMEISVVKEISEEPILEVGSISSSKVFTSRDSVSWGVKRVGAEYVWDVTKGEGIRVALIDTGVRGTHVDLRDNYLGTSNGGWLDATNTDKGSKEPVDYTGHGTHVCGILCGKNGIGVAPDANWMACAACNSDGCQASALIKCGQWVVCPIAYSNGNPQNCSTAPHIVSNSWGTNTGGNTWYNDVIEAWNSTDVISFFSVGNGGPNCSTILSPADQPGVISVGSTNMFDEISDFSSRGPKVIDDGEMTIFLPWIVAPGENITSASNTGDRTYTVLSGTSVATPHAAGVAALLLAVEQKLTLNLKFEEMTFLLCIAAEELVEVPTSECGEIPKNKYPNDMAGCGIPNAARGLEYLNETPNSNDN